jgi:galactose mutarotase-like enzyme
MSQKAHQDKGVIMIIRIGEGDVYADFSSLGGIISNFVWEKSRIIYPERKVGEKQRGGIPICFPFFGIPPEKFSEHKHHGWLRNQELHPIEVSMTLSGFGGKNEPTKSYPWRLEYEVWAAISEMKGLALRLRTKRLADGRADGAPINPAFHPFLNFLGRHFAQIGDAKISEFKETAEAFSFHEIIYIDMGEWWVEMRLGGDFNPESSVFTWSDNPKHYFCVEPVLTRRELFADPKKGKFLYTGGESEITCTIKPLAKSVFK